MRETGAGSVLPGGSSESSGLSSHEPGRPPREDQDRAASRAGRRRRGLLIALGVLVLVVAVVVAVLVAANQRAEPEPAVTLEPEVVTLPVPTPTVDPVELPEGTAFFEALPRTVLQYVVLGAEEARDLVEAGAVEAYRLELGDGGATTLTVAATQWRDVDAATGRLDEVVARETAEVGSPPTSGTGDPDGPADGTDGAGTTVDADADADAVDGDPDADAITQPRFEEGAVRAGDDEVGRYLLLVREDGTATVWWTNRTALVRLDGPADAVRDVYAAFPL